MLIDSHCHIQFNAFKDDAGEVIKRCVEKNVLLNVVGSQRDTSIRAVEYAEKYEDIYATVGLHPVHLSSIEVDEEEIKFKSREEKFDYEFYKKLASHPKVIGIGECGLECFHLPQDKSREEILRLQEPAFLEHHKLARELALPMVIHVRNAYGEIIKLLRSLPPINGVIHCYTGNWNFAKQFLDMGFYLGFTCVVTFPPKKTNPQPQLDLLEVIKNCPADRMLVETDAPYLAPQIYRGQRCEPWMVEEAVKKIAEVKNIDVLVLEKILLENTQRLFTKIKF